MFDIFLINEGVFLLSILIYASELGIKICTLLIVSRDHLHTRKDDHELKEGGEWERTAKEDDGIQR